MRGCRDPRCMAAGVSEQLRSNPCRTHHNAAVNLAKEGLLLGRPGNIRGHPTVSHLGVVKLVMRLCIVVVVRHGGWVATLAIAHKVAVSLAIGSDDVEGLDESV